MDRYRVVALIDGYRGRSYNKTVTHDWTDARAGMGKSPRVKASLEDWA